MFVSLCVVWYVLDVKCLCEKMSTEKCLNGVKYALDVTYMQYLYDLPWPTLLRQ